MMTLIPALFHLAVGLLMKKYLDNKSSYYRDIQLAPRAETGMWVRRK